MQKALGSLAVIGCLAMWGFLALAYAQHGDVGPFALSWLGACAMGWMVVYTSTDEPA